MKKLTIKTYKLCELLYIWLDTKTNIKLQSVLHYKYLIEKYIKNTFIDTDTITKEDIFLFFNKLDISVSTKKKILYILKSTLAFSYEHQYLKEFINLGDIKFNKKCHTIFILSKEEQNILETYLKNKVNIRKICLLLCLYTGLRVGEVSGLKWEDIDFYKHALCVKRTILRIKQGDKTMLIESTPKSETSNRVILI